MPRCHWHGPAVGAPANPWMPHACLNSMQTTGMVSSASISCDVLFTGRASDDDEVVQRWLHYRIASADANKNFGFKPIIRVRNLRNSMRCFHKIEMYIVASTVRHNLDVCKIILNKGKRTKGPKTAQNLHRQESSARQHQGAPVALPPHRG